MDSLSHTLISLIPKVGKPKQVTQFKPITIWNVIYKAVFKTIANRLKHVLPSVISETESAFVPKRSITDNIIVALETTFAMRKQKSAEDGSMALKLDMAKSYDRVEWCFVQNMMKLLGFYDSFIALIMDCISSVTYSIICQGKIIGNIILQRGI